MSLTFYRSISIICFFLLFSTSALANTALVMHSNYQDAHTNVKSQWEADGYTVTFQTSGVVPDNLINNFDVVFDLKYNYIIGSIGIARFDVFVDNGGVLFIVGENSASYSNTNNTVRAFIQNKLGGTLTFQGNTGSGNCGNDCNITQTNTSAGVSSYSNVGVYPYGAYFTGDGTWVAKSTSGKILWMKWSGSELPTGYTGEVYVTFDINQFTSTYDGDDMDNLISDLYASATTTSVTITSSQTTAVNTAKGSESNGINMNVNGDNNTINIQQKGEDNFVIGSDWSSTSTVTGDDNTVNIDQGNITTSGSSGHNGIGLDITGSTNTVNISQGDYSSDSGDHRIMLDIDGSTNTTNLTQRNDGDNNSEHYMSVDIDASSNVLSLQQLNNGDKILFVDIDNANNTVDINQSGSGEHYLDLTLGTGSYSHDVDISQTGSGNHSGRVNLDGYSTDFDLLQQGSTNQNYNLDMTCGTQNGCAVSTTQGN